MADELVAQGRLTRLFGVNYPGNYGYYAVMSEENSSALSISMRLAESRIS